ETAILRSADYPFDVDRSVEAQQDIAVAEQVDRRSPVFKPSVRRAMAGAGGLVVGFGGIGWLRRAIRYDQRRAFISIAERDTGRGPFLLQRCAHLRADPRAGFVARRAR